MVGTTRTGGLQLEAMTMEFQLKDKARRLQGMNT
jgi:Cu/Ag efflux protein CusF